MVQSRLLNLTGFFTHTQVFYMASQQLTYIHVLDEHIFRTANELVVIGISTLSSPNQSLMFALRLQTTYDYHNLSMIQYLNHCPEFNF